MRSAHLLWLVPCISFAGAVSCTRSGAGYYGTTEPKHGPDEIWTNLGTEAEYIDPGKCSDSAGGNIIMNTFAGLLQPHPTTLEPMPDIAERWDVSEDGRIYTFHLRPTTWSDGTPLTAADFVWSWRRVLDPATASKYVSFLYPVRNAEMFSRRALLVQRVSTGDAGATAADGGGTGGTAWSPDEAKLKAEIERIAPVEEIRLAPEQGGVFVVVGGEDAARVTGRDAVRSALDGKPLLGERVSVKLTDASLVGVSAVDDLTLRVELESPVPYFLSLVCYYTTMPVPRHVLERLKREGKNPDLWTRPENVVSNGAYHLSEWRFKQGGLLERNERYWNAKNTRTKRVRLRIIENSNTMLNMYEAGELDSIGSTATMPFEFMDELAKTRDFLRAPQNGVYFFWVNVKRPPLDDARVRNALRLAIDRESLVRHVTRAGQIPSSDLVPDGLGGYVGPHSPVFDPVRARKLLADAGYGPNKPLPPITLSYNTQQAHKQIAEAVQQMWREQLGIHVELENQEWNVHLKNMREHNFQMTRLAWIGDYPDPFTYLDLMTRGSGNNHSQWSDPRYDDLVRRGNQTLDKQARFALLREAEALAMEAAPILPIYVYTRSEMVKPFINGFTQNYEGRHLWKYWWVDRRWYDGIPTDRLDPGFPPSPSKLAAAAEGGVAGQPAAGAN